MTTSITLHIKLVREKRRTFVRKAPVIHTTRTPVSGLAQRERRCAVRRTGEIRRRFRVRAVMTTSIRFLIYIHSNIDQNREILERCRREITHI